jgi:exosortase
MRFVLSRDNVFFFLAVGAAILLSWDNFQKLASDWMTLPAYSHGILVPLVFVLLVYLDRDRLPAPGDRPSLWGLGLIAMGVLFLVAGRLSGLFFVEQVSILFLVSGLVAGYWGLGTLRRLRFPILYLLFMIPLPYILFNALAVPLQGIAAKGGSAVLSGIGVPVFREGNIIHLPHISLGVVKACSGIQSLVSLLAISILVAKLSGTGGIPGVLLSLSAIPVAVLANMLRIAGVGILGSWNPKLAEGFFHLFSGWVVFLFAFVVLLGLSRLFQLFRKGVPHVA